MTSAIPIDSQIKVASITRTGEAPEIFLGLLREVSLKRSVVVFEQYVSWGPAGALVPQPLSSEVGARLIALDQIRSVFRAARDGAATHQWNILTEPFV